MQVLNSSTVRGMETGLRDKGVLLVGGTAGIGRAVAELLAAEGARLVLCGRHDDTLATTIEALQRTAQHAVTGLRCDVTRQEEVDAVVAAAFKALGRVDVLIHTAGDSWKRDIFTVTDEQMYETWALNLLAPVRTIRAVVPHMRDFGGGAIVLLGALSGKQPIAGFVPGNTSKAGVLSLVKGLATDLASANIRINSVCPGRCSSERWMADAEAVSRDRGITVDAFVAERVQEVPMRRLGRPDEIADCVVFLASERASYITGQSISVDGGWGKSII